MIESNCQRHTLELLYNCKINAISSDTAVFSTLYNQIIDISRNTPLYLIYPTQQLQSFALQLKELSLQLISMLDPFFSPAQDNPLKQFRVVSQSPEHVLVRELSPLTESKQYNLTIKQVAKGQRNVSKQVAKYTCPFTAQKYAFTISTSFNSYDFEIPVTNTSTNEEVLTLISNTINNHTSDLVAELVETDSSLQLYIEACPSRSNQAASLIIKDHNSNGVISFYQLDEIADLPQPSDFTINEESHHSFATAFEIDDMFELSLIKPCEHPIAISIETNDMLISNQIQQLQSVLNQLITLAKTCSRKKLELELNSFLLRHKVELSQIGLELDDASLLHSNQILLNHSIPRESLEDLFSEASSFATELLEYTHEFAINPMEYVPSKIVSYKNLQENHYPSPYITSMYSGFLFTNYC